MSISMKDAALRYAKRNIYVMPLHEAIFNDQDECIGCTCEQWKRENGSPAFVCGSRGKHPRMYDWETRATVDADQIQRWWSVWPNANVGIACGPSHLLVLDHDSYKDVYNGDDLLSPDEKETVTVLTGGGGEHLYFQNPNELGNGTGSLPNGIDVRGKGGFVVAVPSKHESGNEYVFETGYGFRDIDVADLPEKIATLLEEVQSNAPEEVIFSDGDFDAPDLWQFVLSERITALIEKGPEEDRSESDQAVITGLVTAGASDDQIRAIFQNYPIGEKYAEKGDRYLSLSIGKARSYVTVDAQNIIAEIKKIASENPDNDLEELRRRTASDIGNVERAFHPEIEAELVSSLNMTITAARNFTRHCRADAAKLKRESKKAAIQEKQEKERAKRTLPTIKVNNRDLRSVAEESYEAIINHNNEIPNYPAIYVRGGLLCRICTDEDGAPAIITATRKSVRSVLAQSAYFAYIKASDKGETETLIAPPYEICDEIIEWNQWEKFDSLRSVVRSPTLSPDGELAVTPGYNPETKSFYANPIDLGDTSPIKENVKKSLDLICNGLLGDFTFADNASKAHAISLLLVPFVRTAIRGSTPLYLIDAPTPGSGKGLLADVCAIPSTGQPLSTMSAPDGEDEMRKRLTSALMRGGSHIALDNLTGKLESDSLAMMLTQEYVEERLLGTNQIAKLRVRCVWSATGNNVHVNTDLARRCIWIRLDVNSEKPWQREDFKHADLRKWALENRADLATAAITLINKWLADDRPKFNGRNKGSYTDWSEIIGGILQSVGIDGFLGNEDELYESAEQDSSAMGAFVEAWATQYGTNDVLSSDLFQIASYSDMDNPKTVYLNLLADLLGSGNERSRKTKMGRLLGQWRGRAVAGYKIQSGTKVQGKSRWHLTPLNSTGSIMVEGIEL